MSKTIPEWAMKAAMECNPGYCTDDPNQHRQLASIIIGHATPSDKLRKAAEDCLVILKGLIVGTDWEIAPPIKKHMVKVEAELSAALSETQSEGIYEKEVMPNEKGMAASNSDSPEQPPGLVGAQSPSPNLAKVREALELSMTTLAMVPTKEPTPGYLSILVKEPVRKCRDRITEALALLPQCGSEDGEMLDWYEQNHKQLVFEPGYNAWGIHERIPGAVLFHKKGKTLREAIPAARTKSAGGAK